MRAKLLKNVALEKASLILNNANLNCAHENESKISWEEL
jgi:hypothetical protein